MSTDLAAIGTTVAGEIERVARLSKQRAVWVRVGKLIDGISERAILDADIVFDAKEIRFVEARGAGVQRVVHGQQQPDLVLGDWTVMPCLIEAHAHLFLDGVPVDAGVRERYLKEGAGWMLERARGRWGRILKFGVGAVRDAGDKYGVGLALAAEAKTRLGELASTPWIDSPGAAIYHRGRYGAFMGEPIEDFAGADECVVARVAGGADRIKLLVSGIINFKAGRVTVPPQMGIEEVKKIVAAAKERGRQTFAHASGTEGVENSVEGGVTTVEHGFFITEDQLARMRDRGIGWVPTFAPVQVQIDRAEELGWDTDVVGNLKRIIEGHQRMVGRAAEMGVRLIAGSDAGSCGVGHGVGFLRELCEMERAGVSAMGVLRAATGVGAETLGFAEPVGRIASGCRARMIFTKHDPLLTVGNLLKEKVVLFDGEVVVGEEGIDVEGL